jgi:hypothetical protein
MAYKKESLEKLLDLVVDISSNPENVWFRNQLLQKLGANAEDVYDINKTVSFESYFKLLKKQLKIKANQFYLEISDKKVKDLLVEDYIKMYWYQINNDVRQMFIHTFFQLERMMNLYANKEFPHQKIMNNPTNYIYTYKSNFTVDCHSNFFKKGNKNEIAKISIWAKVVFWAVDTGNQSFLEYNHFNFSNIINIRNENIHKGIPQSDYIENILKNYKQADNSIFGFYTNILKQIIISFKSK